VSCLFLWGDLLLALTFVSSNDQRAIQTGLLAFTDQYRRREWGPPFAAINLAAFPTIIIFLILNKRVIRGLTAGAVKG
jgi:raffinose/stachyose/melibiose transport system permease protein